MLAHIIGLPVEETALSLAPIAVATGSIVGLKLHERTVRRRGRKRRGPDSPRRAR